MDTNRINLRVAPLNSMIAGRPVFDYLMNVSRLLQHYPSAERTTGGSMSLLLALLMAASATNGPAAVGGLEGCWRASGEVRGKDATSVAKGEWHLGKRYFVLHLRSVPPAQPYEAAITYGAGAKPRQVGSFWMDTFGGLYEPSLGLGEVTDGGFSLDYRFPDAVYHNHFERTGRGWNWTILEQAPGKSDKLFAQYKLARSTCRGISFEF